MQNTSCEERIYRALHAGCFGGVPNSKGWWWAMLLALLGVAMAICVIPALPQLPDPVLAYSPEMLARIHGRQ